jgi:hypothetical protein
MTTSTLTKLQYKHYGPKPIDGYGAGAAIWAKVRFDDECGNGHNTFAITADVRVPKHRDIVAVGCMHHEIAKAFPELAKYIKWHLCSTDGPMHYLANTCYHAGDRDYNGHRKGEPCRFEYGIRFGDSPVTHRVKRSFFDFLEERHGTGDFQVHAIAHGPTKDSYKYGDHYSFVGYCEEWHECPFHDKAAADEFCEGMNRCKIEWVKTAVEFSEGKARELDAARSCAAWPEATDEELAAPDLKERLVARLPALLEEFQKDMEELGFTW